MTSITIAQCASLFAVDIAFINYELQKFNITAPDITVNELGVVSLPYSTNQRDLERDKEEIPLESKELQLSLTPQDLWQTGLQHE